MLGKRPTHYTLSPTLKWYLIAEDSLVGRRAAHIPEMSFGFKFLTRPTHQSMRMFRGPRRGSNISYESQWEEERYSEAENGDNSFSSKSSLDTTRQADEMQCVP